MVESLNATMSRQVPIVDDEGAVAPSAGAYLAGHGFAVDAATEREEAQAEHADPYRCAAVRSIGDLAGSVGACAVTGCR
jgi:hypothetical protein